MMSQNLTAREIESARAQALKAARARLEATRPDRVQYDAAGDGRSGSAIAAVLSWSKAFVPVIALLAALASAVRTVQTASEIYRASGSHEIGVLLAAVAFTVSSEGALFVLALAQEGQRLKWRAEGRPRQVASLLGLWRGLLVRIGVAPARRWDELPETGGIEIVAWIAFVFAVASNAYLGLRPLLAAIGSANLQSFISELWVAPASVQMTFIVDMAAVLFPPLMARQAGHLTARFAAEVAAARASSQAAYEADLARWRAAYNDPLSTDAGREILAAYIAEKAAAKARRTQEAPRPTPTAASGPLPVEITPVQTMHQPTPASARVNRNGHKE